MITGVTNVWTNFSYDSVIDPPNGWLLNQKNSLLILFEINKISDKNNPKVYTHLFFANELGEPGRLKNTRLLPIDCAYETWNELIAGGWTVVSYKFQ